MTSDRGKLGSFLKEVIDWQWDEFVKAEKDTNYTGAEAAVFALIRACSGGKLGAIKLAIDRVDGKVETPIKYEYPKVFVLFPEAKKKELEPSGGVKSRSLTAPEGFEETVEKIKEEPEISEDGKKATMSLRETLELMADQKRLLVEVILQTKVKVELGEPVKKIPLVKSVIAANLLRLAEKNNFEAITEIFDQIDGKLVETIKILGEDLYLTSYIIEAPYGAKKNKDGIYQIEMPQIASQWKQNFRPN